MTTMVERLSRAIREEIVRQYRDDERGKCPAGSAWYEENVSPHRIALAVLMEMREPTEAMLADDGVWAEANDENAKGVWQAMIDAALTERVS